MNGRGPNQQRPGPSGGGGRPTGGGGGDRGPTAATRIEQRLRDQARITYFERPADEKSKPAPRAELFDQEAKTVAKKLAGIPASQLRRFYAGVRTIKRQVDLDKKLGIEFIKAELALLKAKSAYALARLNYQPEGEKDPDELISLLVRHYNSIRDRATFNAFLRHFEAVMAYHKVFEEKRASR